MLALLLAPVTAVAQPTGPLAAYARARAADADGRVGTAAAGYAAALAARPNDAVIAIRAYREGLASGDLSLARRAMAVLVRARVAPADHALLAFADALATGDAAGQAAALATAEAGPLDFAVPVLRAWTAGSGDPAMLAQANKDEDGLERRYRTENHALLLIATGRVEAGVAALRPVLHGPTDSVDLRLAAAAMLAGRQSATARELLSGDHPALRAAATVRRPIRADARFGVSRFFVRLAADLSSRGTEPLAILLTRAALLLDPDFQRARLLLAEALARDGAADGALHVLAEVPPRDPSVSSAQAAAITVLDAAGRSAEAIAIAERRARRPEANAGDLRTYADLLFRSGQYLPAAAAYRDADRRGGADDWALALQRGGALEQGGRWAEALPLLRRAAALAPDQPAVLNYLGYAQAERSENLPEAVRLLRRAVALSPEEPGIADSLGWAYFQQGDLARARPLIEQAARAAPANATIQEHLGDLYWRLGRRYEARYAWAAAAMTAEATAAVRVAHKQSTGLARP